MSPKSRNSETFLRDSRTLEDAFFLEKDKILIERLRSLKKMAETKEALAKASGISNDAILTRLVELQIKPEIVAALATVPLVEVAWADGSIDDAERKAVLTHANAQGIMPGSTEYELLERWLTHKPERRLLEAWQTYVEGLCEMLTAEERRLLRDELMHATRKTAEASGGFLGVGRVSKKEQQILDKLNGSFRI
ncbi:MAG: hypothetical protein JXA30_18235 [Deltaproteobacteria bacterium]|nr:hypothetical protein [Deltaproteobacteria bacterium]